MAAFIPRSQRYRQRAARAGLVYVEDFDEGVRRRRCGRGFTFLSPDGETIRSPNECERFKALVIPPAWSDVWICPNPRGHIQARGRDAAGRLQYIYHPDWRSRGEVTKFDRMERFGDVLPRTRRRIRRDLNRKGLARPRVLAAVARLLDKAHLRVGNPHSVAARGATTLQTDDVELDGFYVSLDFPGKSGKRRVLKFHDPKVAKVIRQCESLDDQRLFGYVDDQGREQKVDATDVNQYLQKISREAISAKDFRTWWGSVIAFATLRSLAPDASSRARKAACREAIKAAAKALGNTVAVCRESYVHPGLIAAAESGELSALADDVDAARADEMTQDEARFHRLLPQLDP